jgi:RNA-directed DNA polymerase
VRKSSASLRRQIINARKFRAFTNDPPDRFLTEAVIVLGFQWETDADRCRRSLGERPGRFGLELHPDKTRRIEFGRYAELNRKRRGGGKPETFDFLGFTHISGKNGNGSYAVRRMTIRKRMRKKLQEIK